MSRKSRGNDILFTPQENADRFDHYHGPLGGDIRQSIRGATVNNRDEQGGQSVQKLGRGLHGPKFRKSSRGDDSAY